MVKVSVIIPIYNMELHLEECLDSVFGQTLKEIEVICVDDGSTDKTLEILNEYRDRYSNLVLIRQQRQGAGKARNKGIEFAKGEFIAFIDSDDYYPSNDVLETLYCAAKSNNVLMAGGNIFRVLESKTISKITDDYVHDGLDKIIDFDKNQDLYAFTCFIYDRNMILTNKIMFPDFIQFEDPPFMLDVLCCFRKFWITQKDVYAYRRFDKKIEYTSVHVSCDIVKGYLYMMKKSKEYNYHKLQCKLINKIYYNKLLFIFHICNNNDELYNLISQIGNEIIDRNERETFLDYWNKENLFKVFDKEKEKLDKLGEKIRKYKNVIIYGAGGFGKAAYDYVITINNVYFIGFAVTNKNPEGTARGHKVQCISNYLEYREDALVIIAVKGESSIVMKKYAESLGFKNILVVDYRIENLKANKITYGKFAFDNESRA